MFYELGYSSRFEELRAYYPRFYWNVVEMMEILKAGGTVLDDISDRIEAIYGNCFIITADEETISKWEQWLDIYYTKKLALEQRRKVVMSYISGHGHIGGPEIREIISWYSDAAVSIELNGGLISIEVADTIFDMDNLYEILKRRLPAHLSMVLFAISTVQIDAPPVRLLHGVGNADTDSSLPVIELDYKFLQNVMIPSCVHQDACSTIPVCEPDYLFRSNVRNAGIIGGADSSSDVVNVERSVDYSADVDTIGRIYGSIMETPIPNL